MVRSLTKSDRPGVNAFFSVTLISSLVSCVLAPVLAWLSQADITFAVESSVLSLLLWWVTLGIFRLVRG
jgi:hypothetical protein